MDAQKKEIATKSWKRGTDAAFREDYDYAIKMFSQSVLFDPENCLFRQTLRGVERKKYKDNKKGARLSGMSIKKKKISISNQRRKEKWDEVDQIAESGLALNPWDAQLNAEMAEACSKRGYKDCAIFGYQCALASDKGKTAYNKSLAKLLEDRGEYTEAIECWKRIHDADPTNGEARSKITQLAASSVMDKGGYEKASSTREMKTGYDYNRPAKTNIPSAVDGPGASLEIDLQHGIRKDPANVDPYLKLADFYHRENRINEEAETLEKALQVKPDVNIREKLEDVQLDLLRQNLTLAKQAAQADENGENARKNAIALSRELLNREIEVLSARVERHTNNSQLKFELAQRFMRRKSYAEAIKQLQGAVADPRLELRVRTLMGECFLREKNRTVARLHFERAAEKANFQDHPDIFKQVHFTLARLCEEEKQRNEAEAHYNEVLAVDYDYRDTRKRLEALQSGPAGAE